MRRAKNHETLWEKLKEELAKSIAQILIAAVLTLAMLIPKDIIRNIDSLIWFWLAVVVGIACIVLLAYVFSKRPKYVLIPDIGIYKEKKTGNYFFASCMANGKKSPLKEYENAFVCMTDFKHIYYKRGKEPKPPKRGLISNGSGWVKNW